MSKNVFQTPVLALELFMFKVVWYCPKIAPTKEPPRGLMMLRVGHII